MSKNDSNSVTFEILLKDYKLIKEENRLLGAEKQNLFFTIQSLSNEINEYKKLFLYCFILIIACLSFLAASLWTCKQLKEENIKLKSQISSERSYK